MSLRITVAAPFLQRGTERLRENEFVVALSLDRDWFSPDQAKRLVDVAAGEGLLDRTEEALELGFDVDAVEIPADFVPDEDLFRQRSVFERVLEDAVDAGIEKREAVGAINACQQRLGVAIEAAAVVYAKREGLDVAPYVADARTAIADGVN